MRRHSTHQSTPSFVPVDNWEGSVHRPQVNAAVLEQPISIQKAVATPAERTSFGEYCIWQQQTGLMTFSMLRAVSSQA